MAAPAAQTSNICTFNLNMNILNGVKTKRWWDKYWHRDSVELTKLMFAEPPLFIHLSAHTWVCVHGCLWCCGHISVPYHHCEDISAACGDISWRNVRKDKWRITFSKSLWLDSHCASGSVPWRNVYLKVVMNLNKTSWASRRLDEVTIDQTSRCTFFINASDHLWNEIIKEI